jgi:hypothetical protein
MEQDESIPVDAFLKQDTADLNFGAFLVEESIDRGSEKWGETLTSSGDQLHAFGVLCDRLFLLNKKIESAPNFPPQGGRSAEFSAIRQRVDHTKYAYNQPEKRQ